MLFDLNGNTYQIKFYRIYPATIAELFIKDGEIFQSLGIEGVSKCNPKDKFEKSKGRKIALAKLLNIIDNSHRGDIGMGVILGKETRTRIWEIYFKEHKK